MKLSISDEYGDNNLMIVGPEGEEFASICPADSLHENNAAYWIHGEVSRARAEEFIQRWNSFEGTNQDRLEKIRRELFDIANSYAISGYGYIGVALHGLSSVLQGILESLK